MCTKEKSEGVSCGAPRGAPSGSAIPRADARGTHTGLRRATPQPETHTADVQAKRLEELRLWLLFVVVMVVVVVVVAMVVDKIR